MRVLLELLLIILWTAKAVSADTNTVQPCVVAELCSQETSFTIHEEELSVVVISKNSNSLSNLNQNSVYVSCIQFQSLSIVSEQTTNLNNEDEANTYHCSREIQETSLQWVVRMRRRMRGLWRIKMQGYDQFGELVFISQYQTHLFHWLRKQNDEYGEVHSELGRMQTQAVCEASVPRDANRSCAEENMRNTDGNETRVVGSAGYGTLVHQLSAVVELKVDASHRLSDLMVFTLQSAPAVISTQPGRSLQELHFFASDPGTTFMEVVGRRDVFWPATEQNREYVQSIVHELERISANEKKALLHSLGKYETHINLPQTFYFERILSRRDLFSSRLFVKADKNITEQTVSVFDVRIASQLPHSKHSQNQPLFRSNNNLHAAITVYAQQHLMTLTHRLPQKSRQLDKTRKNKIRVCLWSGRNLDGQRTIWLQLLRSLDPAREKYTFSVLVTKSPGPANDRFDLMHDARESSSFPFTNDSIPLHSLYPLSEDRRGSSNTFFTMLRDIQRYIDPSLQVSRSPLDLHPFPQTSLYELPSYADSEGFTESLVGFMERRAQSSVELLILAEYAHRRFVAAANVVDRIEPRWTRNLYKLLTDALRHPNRYPLDLDLDDPTEYQDIHNENHLEELHLDDVENESACDLLLLCNGKGATTDVLITDAARALFLPVVLDLPNLHLHPSVTATVVVGPSHFSLQHTSMRPALLRTPPRDTANATTPTVLSEDLAKSAPVAVVIAPAVNTTIFQPEWSRQKEGAEGEVGVVRIAFIGRLVEAKSPGLFLLAAHELRKRMPQVRFVVIGAGHLLPYLQELCVRLQLQAVVQFVPWIPHTHLPDILQNIHIVFNPSLVAASETFCIANIESLSMGISLVTFAVGGIGEYFSDEPFYSTSEVIHGHATATSDGDYGARMYPQQGEDSMARQSALRTTTPEGDAMEESKREEDVGEKERWTVTRTGVLLHSAQPVHVAEALQYLVERPQLRRSLGRYGRTLMQRHFEVDRQVRQYAALFETVHAVYRDTAAAAADDALPNCS